MAQTARDDNGSAADDLDIVSQTALFHFLKVKPLSEETVDVKFPKELEACRSELEMLLSRFTREWFDLCRHGRQSDSKPLSNSKPLPDPRPYKCAYCYFSKSKIYEKERFADWKKHALNHERDHDQQWEWNGFMYKSESSFHQKHVKACKDCEDWKAKYDCIKAKFRFCPCARCSHAELASRRMMVRRACGFCCELFTGWTEYSSHLREHYEERRTPVSSWSFSKAIYALISASYKLVNAFAYVKGEDHLPISLKNNAVAEKLRHELQVYNDDSDDDGSLACSLAKMARDQLGWLDKPRPRPLEESEQSYPSLPSRRPEPNRRIAAAQLLQDIPVANMSVVNQFTDRNSHYDAFMGATNQAAQAEACQSLPSKAPSIALPRNILSPPLLNNGSLWAPEDVSEPPDDILLDSILVSAVRDGIVNGFAVQPLSMEWMAAVDAEPSLIAELENQIGPGQVNSIRADYLSATGHHIEPDTSPGPLG